MIAELFLTAALCPMPQFVGGHKCLTGNGRPLSAYQLIKDTAYQIHKGKVLCLDFDCSLLDSLRYGYDLNIYGMRPNYFHHPHYVQGEPGFIPFKPGTFKLILANTLWGVSVGASLLPFKEATAFYSYIARDLIRATEPLGYLAIGWWMDRRFHEQLLRVGYIKVYDFGDMEIMQKRIRWSA